MRSGPGRPRPSARRWLALFVLACVGCGSEDAPDLTVTVRDSAGIAIHEFPAGVLSAPPSLRLASRPTVQIGVVEGAPEYQWTRPVAGVRLSDGAFAVLEQTPAEIRVFDPSGSYQATVGTEGRGPGELQSPVGLAALAADTLLVWDRGTRRLTWFARDGALLRETTVREPGGILTLRAVAPSPTGDVMVLGPTTSALDLANQGKIRETWQVLALGPVGDEGSMVGSVPGVERDISIQGSGGEIQSVSIRGRWWWGDGFVWASSRGVWTGDRLVPEARHFDRDAGLDLIVRLPSENRAFTPALIDSLHEVELERAADPGSRALWEADFEGREYPDLVPPVASVFADAANRVWIGLTDPPPENLPSGQHTGVRRWAVVEERGPEAGPKELEFLGVVTIPARSHPLYADEEGLLIVRNDEAFDVASIEWYPFVVE